MEGVRIILASASPRRKELLSRLGWTFDVIPSDADESHVIGEPPAEMVMRLSRLKGGNIAKMHPGALVVASDTTVFCDGRLLGKPSDDADAARMLVLLSGRVHQVYSGVALFFRGKCVCSFESTDVEFRVLSDDDIASYIATGEGRGCAGGYAIQGKACTLVRRINGDYSNVVGLPMPLLAEMLGELGFSTRQIMCIRD